MITCFVIGYIVLVIQADVQYLEQEFRESSMGVPLGEPTTSSEQRLAEKLTGAPVCLDRGFWLWRGGRELRGRFSGRGGWAWGETWREVVVVLDRGGNRL